MLMILVNRLILDTGVLRLSSQNKTSIALIKNSIERDGLLNPLVVAKRRNKYVIIDGKKRFIAIRALIKSGVCSRMLSKIPCVLHEEGSLEFQKPSKPTLMTDPELAHAIISQINSGTSIAYIAQRYDCDESVVEDVVSLQKLHLKVLQCFNNHTVSLEQAAALATIPNPEAQWKLLLQLGPFATDENIINAIKAGETVITLPDENILVIPSRDVVMPSQKFDNVFNQDAQDFRLPLVA